MSNPPPCDPVILVPGIKGTELTDEYTTDREAVWSALVGVRQDYRRLALHPDDRRYERIEPARIAAGAVFNVIYEQFLKSLRHELSPREDRPTPVFAFSYDWRRGLEEVQADLDGFIDEVIERTLLLRHYYQSNYRRKPRVHLVGHSMGGLVIAGYLAKHGAGRVAKVATIAAPFRGAASAVLYIATGQASIMSMDVSPAEREVARLLPSIYHLLPGYDGALSWPGGLARSFYKPLAWQPSVYQTIAEYIRLYSRSEAGENAGLPDRIAEAARILISLLGAARRHRRGVDTLDLEAAGLSAADWLCIAGIGEPTVDRIVAKTVTLPDPEAFSRAALFEDGQAIEIDLVASGPVDTWDRTNHATSFPRTGDSTVALPGATPAFLPYEQLIAVTREHYEWWELSDRFINGVVDLHASLPRMNAVQSMVIAHFLDRDVRAVRALPAPGVSAADWRPTVRGLIRG
ncbi:MAG TPA: alpha/beta fold hydrolase [Rhodanobacteraceae bacterium]|nr:alpha/beta fold hydrolase [Rhodanobacteraceae bacterium]